MPHHTAGVRRRGGAPTQEHPITHTLWSHPRSCTASLALQCRVGATAPVHSRAVAPPERKTPRTAGPLSSHTYGFLERMDLGASRTSGMEAAAFGPSRCVDKRGGRERKGRRGHRRGASSGGGTGVLRAERKRSEEETKRRHNVFLVERSGCRIGSPRIYLLGRRNSGSCF